MNTKKLELAIEQLQKVHRDMNDCANRFILKDAIDQLQEQVKLFAIPDVIKSVCRYCGEDKYFRTDGKKVQCCNCGKSWRQTVL